jgi:hypothetical protein
MRQGLSFLTEVSPSGVCVVLAACIVAPMGVRYFHITGNGLAVVGVYNLAAVVVLLVTRTAQLLWGRGGSEVVVCWRSRHSDGARGFSYRVIGHQLLVRVQMDLVPA